MEETDGDTQSGARPTARVSGSEGKKLLSGQEVRLVLLASGALVFLAVAYLLLSYSAFLGFLLIAVAVLAVLILRKNRGTQTGLEQRLFEVAGLYGRSARRAYDEGRHKEIAQNAYRQSRRAYEGANTRYQGWREQQAAERERNEALRGIERERGERRERFDRYRRFFKRAHEGSRDSLDWWRGYDTGEFDDERSSVSDLLLSVRNRAGGGLKRLRQVEGTLENALQHEEFEKADLLLDGVRASQEDFQGEESVFPPLVAVHERIKRSEDWANYRRELEGFVKDLEDLLESPNVRTAAANRVRFPDPSTAASPQRSSPRAMTDSPRDGSPVKPESPKACIDSAVPFMLARGFSLENRSDAHVTFVRSGEEIDGASCLIIVILLLLGILPGILYAIYVNTRRVHTNLTAVLADGEVEITTSGNDKGGRSALNTWAAQHGFQ